MISRLRGLEFLVVPLGHQPVTPDALPPIVAEKLRPESLRHGAFRAAIVLQQLFQAILGLRVTRTEGRARGVLREDVRHPIFVPQDGHVRTGGQRQAAQQ